ncbi:LexA family transcriptional regulator [Aureimonas mangrovi]|uniref:LexA family transcriptional regulator n=1 Tax=Aureimonas mangrovi TaxID=2758041 RepID=UPI00163DC3C9|nr:LexA family transcriptional regulator [Aureimonas mangrovi]
MQNRLSEIMRQRGFSREKLAEAVDAHPITISKLASGTMGMTTKWMEKLGSALGVSPIEILIPPARTRSVQVRGAVQAGAFVESLDWPDRDDWYDVAVPDDERFRHLPLYAREARGTSMNKRYPDGTVLIFTAPWDDHATPEPGARYVVERQRPDGTIEGTVKRLHRDPEGGLWLIAESDDPRWQKPISLDGEVEDEIVRIVGRVRYAVTREE